MSEWELRLWENTGLETAHITQMRNTNDILVSDSEEMSPRKTSEQEYRCSGRSRGVWK